MPAYHSKLEDDAIAQQACSCGIIALKTNIRGPADAASPGTYLLKDNTLSSIRVSCILFEVQLPWGSYLVSKYCLKYFDFTACFVCY